MAAELPPPELALHEGIAVVRDDKVPGGTKRRFIDGYIAQLGAREFVYASPAYGGAQIALAIAALEAGKNATIFVAKRKELHARSLEAQRAGAKIVEVPHGYLSNVQAKARAYAAEVGAHLMPFGFDTPEAIDAVARAAAQVRIAAGGRFREVWCVAGSGVLSRALQQGRLGYSYCSVAVGRDGPNIGRAELIEHPQPFDADARMPPPFPSCSNYDAKAWQHIVARHPQRSSYQLAERRVLLWNVMR